MMLARTLLRAIVAVSLLWPAGAQSQGPDPHDPMFPHEEHVFFSARTTHPARQAGQRITVYITYPNYARPLVRIDVPKSFTVLSDETGKAGPGVHRTIEVKANRRGLYKIRGSLTLHFADGIDDHIDEQMWEMPVVVTQDSIWAGWTRDGIFAGWTQDTRCDRIDRTGRYRRDEVLVPIDGPDPFAWHDLRDRGVKPQPIRTVGVRWDSCGMINDPINSGVFIFEGRDRDGVVDTTVGCRVVVDKAGRVMSAGCPYFTLDAPFRKAIEDAARQWRFRPARLGSRTVNDWTGVPVPVKCGPRD